MLEKENPASGGNRSNGARATISSKSTLSRLFPQLLSIICRLTITGLLPARFYFWLIGRCR
jgi:hypothetical protein